MQRYTFPPTNQNYTYLQTNRSDDYGSLWSTFNNDYQTNLGVTRLSPKLVINTSSTDNSRLGCASAFEYYNSAWWAICGTSVFTNYDSFAFNPLTDQFVEEGVSVGTSTTQFDVTNPAGTTFRYTFDGTGTNPGITALTFPVGSVVYISPDTNFTFANTGTFTVTGSGANYFEITNASGVVESNITINGGYIAIAGGSLSYSCNAAYSDLAVFNSLLWMTTNTKLYSRDGYSSPFVEVDTLTSSACHKMCYFKQFNRLYYVADGQNIYSIDSSNVIADGGDDYSINLGDLETTGIISTMVATPGSIFIGTLRANNASNCAETQGVIYEWDGISAQATTLYELPTAGVISMLYHEGLAYAVDTEGRILKQKGYSFSEIGRLPITRILGIIATIGSTSEPRFIHMNGFVATKNNTLLLNINNKMDDASRSSLENMQSGIWEFDLNTNNFTHRQSYTYKSMSSSTITDYGQNTINVVGALKLNTLNNIFADTSAGRSTLVCGATYYTDATSSASAIFIDSPASPDTDTEGQKRGYFVTTWFNSNEIQDKWSRIWVVYRRFLDSSDKIICKYRLNEEDPVRATITWTSTTTFTTTTDVSAYAPTASPFNGTTGGEVEIIRGTGGGSSTHISDISESGGTYTVTLDTAVTGVTGTAIARFQKWVKVFPEATGQVLSYEQMSIGDSNTRVQIKVVMEFTGDDEFHKFVLTSNEDITAQL